MVHQALNSPFHRKRLYGLHMAFPRVSSPFYRIPLGLIQCFRKIPATVLPELLRMSPDDNELGFLIDLAYSGRGLELSVLDVSGSTLLGLSHRTNPNP